MPATFRRRPIICETLGADAKALAIVNAERAERDLTPLARRPLSPAWQDLVKAAVAEQLLFKRNTTGYVMQCIARPLRVIATCVDKEPWQLTVDDLRLAIRVGKAIQATGKLGDLVAGIVKVVFDAQHLCDAGQLYSSLAVPRMKMKSAIKAKHTWSQDELRTDLEARKREERLPERRAFWELTRIVMTEKPRTFMDDLRFAAIRTMIVTGFRIGEAALLPVDWKRERTYLDVEGAACGRIRWHLYVADGSPLRGKAAGRRVGQSLPARKNTACARHVPGLLTETLDHVAKLTEPLRATLKLQCETGRLLPWYPADDLVPFTEVYTRSDGQPVLAGHRTGAVHRTLSG